MNNENMGFPSDYVMRSWDKYSFDTTNHILGNIKEEAKYSSAIENLYDEDSIKKNSNAIAWFYLNSISTKPVNHVILQAHGTLMKGQHQFNPGKWREYNVRVGLSVPPHYDLVPNMMKEFDEFNRSNKYDNIFKAVYGHLWFERVHPFADGNGRIGRAIASYLLKKEISKKIYEDRQTYYYLLGMGSWDEWKDWFLGYVLDINNG